MHKRLPVLALTAEISPKELLCPPPENYIKSNYILRALSVEQTIKIE